MGFFSWKTQDTNRSITNKWSNYSTFKVDMIDDKGNVWTENHYDGYGVFGGKDYYELLAEMNGVTSDLEGEQYTDFMRIEGIDIAFKDNGSGVGTKGVKYPNLFEDSNILDYQEEGPDTCEYQGFFYEDEEDNDEDGEWLSDCCGASEWQDETGICDNCKEHADFNID
jgi:hypothetical protein